MLIIFPSGTFLCFKDACGINFWGVHGHDGIWHLAMASVAFKNMPFISPTYSGELLYGYNYLLDFLIFILSKIGLPPIISYFKILPVIWFFSFTLSLVSLAIKINKSKIYVLLFLFYSFFGGSFAYFLTLWHSKNIEGSSSLMPQPIMHMMSNLPYAFSLIPLLYLLNIIKQGKATNRIITLASLNILIIMGLKFYGGVISIFMMLLFILFTFISHKNFKFLISQLSIVFAFIVLGVLFFYNPALSIKTGSIFGWSPLALVHTITEQPNQFYLQTMTDARYFLVSHGIGPRLILIESINILIFLIFYLGSRFFGLLFLIFLLLRRKASQFDLIIFLTTIFAFTLTMTLVQKAEWWNTIQFFFYAIFLLTIYLATLTYEVLRKKKFISLIIVMLLLLLSVPTALDLIPQFTGLPGATYISAKEIEALAFLKKQPSGIVLTPLYNKEWKMIGKTNPLYAYEDTAYISAMSGQQSYYANELQLRLIGVPYQKRLKKLKSNDCSIITEVNYVYEIKKLPERDKVLTKCKSERVKQIFTNSEVTIYSISKS
ncbi:hypothetical protein A3J15_00685 [Candidatus Roizmanbacteria bacterium RIFCSPLOWO2_02_FULL_38_10]|uniref:Glycosyltransferase RgtA/B/C/D-like domain-containing protein n=1 Tax=Candidatus Roizmanbacteria bacterium RIFCSPLOWO2_02_FULL_38_10 TaxID=1802074 RepID=A0A1F7JMR2_9BACT|nr:MAG: hypothetical protein A3J15_00685 [Candidatus Roizmanbacteria bacterium RIFCSPLOWO2_02_FULL_38_10]